MKNPSAADVLAAFVAESKQIGEESIEKRNAEIQASLAAEQRELHAIARLRTDLINAAAAIGEEIIFKVSGKTFVIDAMGIRQNYQGKNDIGPRRVAEGRIPSGSETSYVIMAGDGNRHYGETELGNTFDTHAEALMRCVQLLGRIIGRRKAYEAKGLIGKE